MTDVLVTGANRGIGLGLVQEYLTRGARVFAACRDPGSAEAGEEHLIPVRMDVTDADQVAAAAAVVAANTDGLDVLINNAGVYSTDAIPVRVVLSVRVDGSLAERLAVAANRVGVSVSELVRTWLTERIEVERTHVDRLRIANDLEQIARLVRAGM